MRLQPQKRRGIVAVLVSICLIAILGVVAIALDGGLLLDNKRRMQAAADAAALAAATDIYNTGDTADAGGTAAASALSTAAGNGFTNDTTNSVVTVNIPPLSGSYTGKSGYAEVIVQYNQRRSFSSIFGSGNLPVRARAVACGKRGDIGILILDPQVTVAAQIMGNINILNDGQIYCNSDSSVRNGEFGGYGTVGGVYLESTAKLVTGGVNVVGWMTMEPGSQITYTGGGGLKTGVGPWPDPLANVPEPTLPTGTALSVNAKADTTIDPGYYKSISIQGNKAPYPTLTMRPGVYYITGGITVDDAYLVGNGVMIYNNSGDSIKFDNAAGVTLTPPTSGVYRGISLFEPRAETHEVHIKCSNDITIAGTLYAQNGEFDLRPNGATTHMNCGNYICGTAEWAQGYGTGKSDGIVNLNPNTAAPTLRPVLVE